MIEMTGKERIFAALNRGMSDLPAVGIDYMWLYLAERMERACVAS